MKCKPFRLFFIAFVFCCLLYSAALSQNLLQNQGFETGDDTNWTVQCDDAAFTVTKQEVRGGQYSASLSGSWSGWSWNNVYQEVDVSAGQEYCMSSWMYVKDLAYTGSPVTGIKLEGLGVSSEDKTDSTTSDWEKFHVLGKPTSSGKIACRLMDSGTDISNSKVYFDDADLFPNQLSNSGFETGDLTDWNVTNDNPGTMDIAADTAVVKSGTYAAKFEGTWTGWGWHCLAQEAAITNGTKVVLYGKMNIVQCDYTTTTNPDYPRIGVKLENVDPVFSSYYEEFSQSETGGWRSFKTSATAIADGNFRMLLYACGEGFTWNKDLQVYFDDIAIGYNVEEQPIIYTDVSSGWELYD